MRWVGFTNTIDIEHKEYIGIIIQHQAKEKSRGDVYDRYDILWSDGQIGTGVYNDTIQPLWRIESI